MVAVTPPAHAHFPFQFLAISRKNPIWNSMTIRPGDGEHCCGGR